MRGAQDEGIRAKPAWGRDTYPVLGARPGGRPWRAPLGGWRGAIREGGPMYSIVYIVGAVVILGVVLRWAGLY